MGQEQSSELRDALVGFSAEGKFKRKLTDIIYNGLKCYEIIDGKITAMSLVTNPANGYKAKIVSEEERIIAAPVLIPNKMIYRINPITGEEHYIFFTAEVIQKMFSEYRKENWAQKERLILVNMFAEGKSLQQIAVVLNRSEDEIENRIKEEGDVFLHCAISLMVKNGDSIRVMAQKLNLTQSELIKIISDAGLGQIVVRKPR